MGGMCSPQERRDDCNQSDGAWVRAASTVSDDSLLPLPESLLLHMTRHAVHQGMGWRILRDLLEEQRRFGGDYLQRTSRGSRWSGPAEGLSIGCCQGNNR